MADAYDYWRRELDLPGSQTRDTGESVLGWWRTRGAKTKWDTPAVVWKDDSGRTWLKRSRMDPTPEGSDAWWGWFQWQFIKADAVSQGEYQQAMDTGVWPDGKPAFRQQGETGREVYATKAGDLIHDPENDGPLLEMLADEIDSLADAIARFPAITDMKLADRGAELHRRMRVLWKKADEERAKAKEPHFRAAQGVDNEWRPLLEKAKDFGSNMDAQVKDFLRAEEQRRMNEARQKAEAERLARLAEEPEAEPATEPEPIKLKATPTSGGRGISLRTVKKGRITDEAKFIRAIKDRPDFKEFVQSVADKLAKADQPTKGMEIYEDRV